MRADAGRMMAAGSYPIPLGLAEANPRFLHRLLAGACLLSALIVSLAALSLYSSRQQLMRLATVNVENLAETLQLTIADELTQIDTALRNVAMTRRRLAARGALDPEALAAVLDEQLALAPELEVMSITNADGSVRVARGARAAGHASVAGQRFFRLAQESAELAISDPEPDTRESEAVITFARRLERPDGSFDGVAYAQLPIGYFLKLFASLDLGAQGVVTLRSANMSLLARHSVQAAARAGIGSATMAPDGLETIRLRPDRGVLTARTVSDQVERTTAYRRVAGFPMTVLVGLATADSLAPWHTQFAQESVLAGLLLMVVAGSYLLTRRAWRREAESARALRTESRRNQALLRTASDGIHILDRSGTLVEMSESFGAMLGRSRDELVGCDLHAWDAGLTHESIGRCLREFAIGDTHKFETRHRRSDGSLIDVEVSSALVHIDEREFIYCSARDITSRKRLEAQLAAAAKEARALYDSAPCAYHSLDADGKYVHINATELAWLECEREDVVGKLGAQDFFTPEGQLIFRLHFQRLKTDGRIEGLELDLVSRTGHVRHVSITATALYGAHGGFQMSHTVMFDITELSRARQQLQQALLEQQAMLDNDLIGIIRMRDRRISWMNPAMNRIFGYRHHELIGESSRVLYADEETFEQLGRSAYPVVERGGRFRMQVPMRHKNGDKMWIDVSGVKLPASREESLWLLADITPIRQAFEDVQHMAFHDVLTGLPNRLLFADRMKQALLMAQRQERRLAVCYLDLDGFKQVNDRHGHAAGDLLLKEIAQRLSGCVRAHDTVCRLGGDEFVLLLKGLEQIDECRIILARIKCGDLQARRRRRWPSRPGVGQHRRGRLPERRRAVRYAARQRRPGHVPSEEAGAQSHLPVWRGFARRAADRRAFE